MPPFCGTLVGSVRTFTVLAAAPPTRTSTSVARAPPENAVIFAVPEAPLARNVVRAIPPSVRTTTGSTWPTDAWNVTSVPLWTGVPAASITVAITSAAPFDATDVELIDNVTVDPVGANNATLSQATVAKSSATREKRKVVRDTAGTSKYSRRMGLGQGN